MIPTIKCITENSQSSIFQLSISSKNIEETVHKVFKKKEFSSIIESPIQLYVTIFVSEIHNSIESTVDVQVSDELDGDHDIYRLQCALTNLKFADKHISCKILIDTKEYSTSSNEKNSEPSAYIAIEPKWTFDKIILTDDVKKRLMRAISIIEYKDIIFNTLEYSNIDHSTKSILCFYGPAGTGKTITADAVAKYLGKKIMVSSYAQIESKYVGDGAKNLRAIFKAAEEQDAVLFMDEADSFLSKRIESTDSSSDKHYNRMSNELFQLLENFNGCVIFSTNLMTDIDKAFKSRIVDSIMFPLPDKDCRVKMLKHMVPSKFLSKVFTEDELLEFAEKLNGFSGRDIRKSILLSYANIAPKVHSIGLDNYIWNKEEFCSGFNDVSKTVEVIEDLPIDEVQCFTDEIKENRKLFEAAKHAVIADHSPIDSRESALLKDLSQQLLHVELSEEDFTPTMSLVDICSNASDEFKIKLIDALVRVITVDGDLSANEIEFLSKTCNLLEFTDDKTESILAYAKSMATSYEFWIKSINTK